MKLLNVLILGTLGTVLSGTAEESAYLSLNEAVQKAVRENYRIQISRLNPEIAETFLISAQSEFDWEVFGESRVGQTEQNLTFTQTAGTSSDNRNHSIGARRQFSAGTTVTAQTNLNRRSSNAGVNTSNLSQEADASLSVRQPLLSGYGTRANLANIRSREAAVIESEEQLRQTLLDLVADTESAYWNVARLQENLRLQESSLEVAEELLNEALERERVGLATKIEVLQARSSRAERKEAVIELQRSLGEAQDRLFVLLNFIPANASLYEEMKVNSLPESVTAHDEFQAIWQQARLNNPQLNAQDSVLAQIRQDRLTAREEVRPSLDLTVTGAYIGLDDQDAAQAYESAIDGDGTAWSLGIEFSMPWGFRSGKATVSRVDKQLRQETLRLASIEQDLLQSVRASWRNLEAQRSRVEAALVTVELQEATFEQEKEKYQNGLSVFRDVLEAQRDLDQARSRLSQAKFEQLNAAIELTRLDGTLLQKYDLSPEPSQ